MIRDLVMRAGPPQDPYFASVVSLMHFNAEPFVDIKGNTVSAGGTILEADPLAFKGVSATTDPESPLQITVSHNLADTYTIELRVAFEDTTPACLVYSSFVLGLYNSLGTIILSVGGSSYTAPTGGLSPGVQYYIKFSCDAGVGTFAIDGVALSTSLVGSVTIPADTGFYIGGTP